MDCKYTKITEEQMIATKNELNKKFFLLLPFKEEGYEKLSEYFNSLLLLIGGMNSLFGNPYEIVEILCLLKAAKIESEKPDFDHATYRKLVFDAQGAVEKLK